MKALLVIADGSESDADRFICAESIIAKTNGYMTVAVVRELPSLLLAGGDMGAGGAVATLQIEMDDEVRSQAIDDAQAVAARFMGGDHLVSILPVTERLANLGWALGKLAHTRDLSITALPSSHDETALRSTILDGLLSSGGKGVLGLPAALACPREFSRIAIAWNGSAQCARALQNAMPLIRHAVEVTVIIVDQPIRVAGEDGPGDNDVRTYLSHHGVDCKIVSVASGSMNVAGAIQAEALRLNADMLVMGAQPEGIMTWFFGSTSRSLVADAELPLLMAS